MQRTCGDFSSWKIDDNYVSFDVEMQGEEIVLENAYLHMIADTFLGSYPDHRNTISTGNRTTAQDIEATVDKMKQICDFNVGAELYSWESLIMEGKHAVLHAEGPKIEIVVPALDAIPSSTHQDIPPQDNQRLALDATNVIKTINGLRNRDFASLFQNIDLLQGIFNLLKPSHDPVFRFQRDHQDGGLIYWQGRYRKWFNLLQEDKKTASDAPEKQYLNLLYPGMKSSNVRRKFWVAMDCDLRNRVVNGNMTIKDAMDALSKKKE